MLRALLVDLVKTSVKRVLRMAESKPKSGWETLLDQPDVKKFGAHNERNQGPILEQIIKYLPAVADGPVKVLEVASGTGQHAFHHAGKLGDKVVWQPTDFDPICLASVKAWTEELPNVRHPLMLDASKPFSEWPIEEGATYDVLYNCNTIHIAPKAVMTGLLAGAGQAVRPGGRLFIYGPFRVDGQLCESNAKFDASLRSRDASWGVRDIEEVDRLLAEGGFEAVGREEMPSNNLFCVWQKVAASSS